MSKTKRGLRKEIVIVEDRSIEIIVGNDRLYSQEETIIVKFWVHLDYPEKLFKYRKDALRHIGNSDPIKLKKIERSLKKSEYAKIEKYLVWQSPKPGRVRKPVAFYTHPDWNGELIRLKKNALKRMGDSDLSLLTTVNKYLSEEDKQQRSIIIQESKPRSLLKDVYGESHKVSDWRKIRLGSVVVKDFLYIKCGKAHWSFICDCGNEEIIDIPQRRENQGTKDCWLCSEYGTTHGHAVPGHWSPTYTTWRAMRTRCLNPNSSHFIDYGKRGITICQRWDQFENFLKDMGTRPQGQTLDRVDNNGNYCSENCRWATPLEQSNNRRNPSKLFEYNGLNWPLGFIVNTYSENNTSLVRARLRNGWDLEEALTAPKCEPVNYNE